MGTAEIVMEWMEELAAGVYERLYAFVKGGLELGKSLEERITSSLKCAEFTCSSFIFFLASFCTVIADLLLLISGWYIYKAGRLSL